MLLSPMTKTAVFLEAVPAHGTVTFNPPFEGWYDHEYLCREDLALMIEKQMEGIELREVDMTECEGIEYLAFFGNGPDPMVEIPL
jgi:hypothetical protein